MRVTVLGAGGIIGTHMMLCVPEGVEARFYRRNYDRLFARFELVSHNVVSTLDALLPDVIVNLAGESDTDKVERDQSAYFNINVLVPSILAGWCSIVGKHYIHVSTQAVFSGDYPPYGPESMVAPVNAYGRQRVQAEQFIRTGLMESSTIVRPTFILGVRPIPSVGRKNPVEQMLEGQTKQVNDRFFSILYAGDAAELLWEIVLEKPKGKIIHLGTGTVSRFNVANDLGVTVERVPHSSFPGIAPRPVNTTYDESSRWLHDYGETIRNCNLDYQSRQNLGMEQRAKEIALFLEKREDECLVRLQKGFGYQHAAVRGDFLKAAPGEDDEKLLEWYKTTETYIWELSVYHADPGFNYSGMCQGIVEKLKPNSLVLCLGDGIGDLSMSLKKAGHLPVYNDLLGSRTAEFALFRFWMYGIEIIPDLSTGWEPKIQTGLYDAIVSLDFLEHVTSVESWVRAIWDQLKLGGLLVTQNAFAVGSGPQGSIPMHLARNDHWEKDWDSYLFQLGFSQISSNWYQKPVTDLA